MEIEHKIFSQKELNEKAKGLPIEDYIYGTFEDFEFFSKPCLIEKNKYNFLVALDKSKDSPNDIVGIIKYGFEKIENKDYLVIRYGETKKGFKGKGINKGILKKFNSIDHDTSEVVFTDLINERLEFVSNSVENYLTNYKINTTVKADSF